MKEIQGRLGEEMGRRKKEKMKKRERDLKEEWERRKWGRKTVYRRKGRV